MIPTSFDEQYIQTPGGPCGHFCGPVIWIRCPDSITGWPTNTTYILFGRSDGWGQNLVIEIHYGPGGQIDDTWVDEPESDIRPPNANFTSRFADEDAPFGQVLLTPEFRLSTFLNGILNGNSITVF